MASDASALTWHINLRGLALAQTIRIDRSDGRELRREEIESLLSDVQRIEASGNVLTRGQAEIVAGVELVFGDALASVGQNAAARGHWLAAAERLEAQSASADYSLLTLLARARLRLGHLNEARALAARVASSNYRHPAHADLVQELAQGRGLRCPSRPQGEFECQMPMLTSPS